MAKKFGVEERFWATETSSKKTRVYEYGLDDEGHIFLMNDHHSASTLDPLPDPSRYEDDYNENEEDEYEEIDNEDLFYDEYRDEYHSDADRAIGQALTAGFEIMYQDDDYDSRYGLDFPDGSSDDYDEEGSSDEEVEVEGDRESEGSD